MFILIYLLIGCIDTLIWMPTPDSWLEWFFVDLRSIIMGPIRFGIRIKNLFNDFIKVER